MTSSHINKFDAKRITRTYVQKIEAAPDKIFPLLCPVRESEWLEGWQCQIIYSRSGLAEKDCIFKTSRDGEAETVWTMTEYDRDKFIEFLMVTPGSRVGRLEIEIIQTSADTSDVHISYTFTALAEAGNLFIDAYTEDLFNQRMQWWERSMNHFLATGRLLKSGASV